jgi:hypothetical protein
MAAFGQEATFRAAGWAVRRGRLLHRRRKRDGDVIVS